MKWAGYLTYAAKHKDINSVLKGDTVPVKYFSVSGGATRIIDLDTTDDISVVSEFEQARHYKNVTLFLESTTNFEWLDLMEIKIHNLPFAITFHAMGFVGGTITHEFNLISKKAMILQPPDNSKRVNKGNRLLKVKLNLPDAQLEQGSGGKGAETFEDW